MNSFILKILRNTLFHLVFISWQSKTASDGVEIVFSIFSSPWYPGLCFTHGKYSDIQVGRGCDGTRAPCVRERDDLF